MTTMEQCRLGEHDKCPGDVMAAPGEFGGILCDCPCHRPNVPEPDVRLEREFWRAVERSRDPTDFELYLREFPEGIHAAEARSKLQALRAQGGQVEPEEP